MTNCRFPFACSTTACEKCAAPDPIAVKLDRFNANAASRAEQARQGRLTLLAVWVVTFTLSLGLLAVAAHSGLARAERAYQEARV